MHYYNRSLRGFSIHTGMKGEGEGWADIRHHISSLAPTPTDLTPPETGNGDFNSHKQSEKPIGGGSKHVEEEDMEIRERFIIAR
ncbi:hypothetical protein CEXT_315301 [Caerostris extrusa]|uniref:Uncharacterized protein n=1 Tax=Caerostris extrusa TaxID=172846 RepID=A0AAV4P710_CAEEX|nr:hypothetical protein CEXT_315301 [Caerostris extrusa]